MNVLLQSKKIVPPATSTPAVLSHNEGQNKRQERRKNKKEKKKIEMYFFVTKY